MAHSFQLGNPVKLVSLSIFPCLIFLPSAYASSVFQKDLERAFATSVILTDSDVFTVGFHDFDPNEWFNLEQENIGTSESLSGLNYRDKESAAKRYLSSSHNPYTEVISDHNGRIFDGDDIVYIIACQAANDDMLGGGVVGTRSEEHTSELQSR